MSCPCYTGIPLEAQTEEHKSLQIPDKIHSKTVAMLFIQINMPKHVFDITVALRKKAFSILFNDFRSSLLQEFLTINRSFTHSELDSESV